MKPYLLLSLILLLFGCGTESTVKQCPCYYQYNIDGPDVRICPPCYPVEIVCDDDGNCYTS